MKDHELPIDYIRPTFGVGELMSVSRRVFIENGAFLLATVGACAVALPDSAPMVSESDPIAAALGYKAQMPRASTRRNSLSTPGPRVPTALYIRVLRVPPRAPASMREKRCLRRVGAPRTRKNRKHPTMISTPQSINADDPDIVFDRNLRPERLRKFLQFLEDPLQPLSGARRQGNTHLRKQLP